MAQASKPIMKEIGTTNVEVKNQRADELDPGFLCLVSLNQPSVPKTTQKLLLQHP